MDDPVSFEASGEFASESIPSVAPLAGEGLGSFGGPTGDVTPLFDSNLDGIADSYFAQSPMSSMQQPETLTHGEEQLVPWVPDIAQTEGPFADPTLARHMKKSPEPDYSVIVDLYKNVGLGAVLGLVESEHQQGSYRSDEKKQGRQAA